jgi:hypothetical protein
MNMMGVGTLSAAAMMLAASMIAAPQKYPGQSTDARVWIENRTKMEAIAVSLQDAAPDAFVGVRVQSMPPVQISGGVERKRQQWEYRTIVVRPGQDIASELNRAGADNWEVTGSHPQNESGMLFVLKRPK